MNVAGQTTYNTFCGLLCTICVIILVLVYAVVKAQLMWNFDATTFMSKEVNNAIDIDKIYTYKDTNFAVAFGLVDKSYRPIHMPNQSDLARYFTVEVNAVTRISDDKDADADEQSIAIRPCTESDKAYFYDFKDLNTHGIEQAWENLLCVTNPTLVKF